MTAVVESLSRADAEQEIRRSVVMRSHRSLYIHECATSWITALVQNPAGRPADAVLADIATVCEALAEVDLDFFSCEGTG